MPQEQPSKQEQAEPKIEKAETAQEKPAQTMEDLQRQVEALQKQMEQMKQQSQETAAVEIQRLDQSSEKLGTAKTEEVEAVKAEVAQIETQKQETVTQAEDQIQEVGEEATEEAPAEKEEIANEISTQEDELDLEKRETKRLEAFELKLQSSSPELQKELNQAKQSQEYWQKGVDEVGDKQRNIASYEIRVQEARELLQKLPEFKTKFADILDGPVTIDRTQHTHEMIRFKGVSEREQSELSYRISELSYEVSKNKDFEVSVGVNLGNLLSQLEDLAKYKSNEQPPSQNYIKATQQEANVMGANRNKARKEVEEIEAKIWSN